MFSIIPIISYIIRPVYYIPIRFIVTCLECKLRTNTARLSQIMYTGWAKFRNMKTVGVTFDRFSILFPISL